VFTLDLSLNAGLDLEFEQTAGGPTTIKPTLLGITPSNVQITVSNADFVREPAAQLQAVLPTVFSLVTPLLGNLPDITVPQFASFELDNLALQHIKSGNQDFLEVYGSLAASQALRRASSRNPALGGAVAALDAKAPTFAAPSTGRASLDSVSTPPPADVIAALQHTGGGLPQVTFTTDQVDASGRPLEWAYQINGGMWRSWQTGPLVVEDQAFAWQGKYTIGVKSRVKGDYHTVSATTQFPVIIDSVAPRIAADKAAWNGDTFEVPAVDIVSGTALAFAFGRPGATKPESPWVAGDKAQLGRDAANAYADGDGKVAVFAKDEAGNTAVALVTPGTSAGSGGCAVGGAPTTGGLVLVLLVAGLVLRRRRAAQVVTCGAALLLLQPACSSHKNNNAGGQCEMDSDCGSGCPPGQLDFCVQNTCACSSDIIIGQVGQYSDLATGPDGSTWVSAYAGSHGDLVVAQVAAGTSQIADDTWEWVDGVPAGPVVVPGSKIRGGISDPGPDVGLYTSIQIAPDNVPMVSYFDHDGGALKLAQKINGKWQTSVVDQGTGSLDGATGSIVGMYTSITLRSDDGRPGIAYLAHVKDAQGTHAEVRFASAQSPHPSAPGDWQTWVVDSAPLPAADPNKPDVFPLPAGLGLFVDSARMADQSPVVVYYDRANGQLKLARFNVAAGQFAAPVVLDGSNGVDAGWTPSVAVDNKGNIDVAYVSATTTDSLHFATTAAGVAPSVIDDGMRTDGTTVDGLPRPVLHFVGANAKLILPGGDLSKAYVVYQDATTAQLLLGHHESDGSWSHSVIAGGDTPYTGGYGFYAAGALNSAGLLVLSSWVIDLPGGPNDDFVDVFTQTGPL
jgi:MYXO-CTERM domain-containing protein